MDSSDNIPDHAFFSAEESPIPVPPVEESWALMEKKMDDDRRPVAVWWTSPWFIFAGIVSAGLMAWFAVHFLVAPGRRGSAGGGAASASVVAPDSMVRSGRAAASGRDVLSDQGAAASGGGTAAGAGPSAAGRVSVSGGSSVGAGPSAASGAAAPPAAEGGIFSAGGHSTATSALVSHGAVSAAGAASSLDAGSAAGRVSGGPSMGGTSAGSPSTIGLASGNLPFWAAPGMDIPDTAFVNRLPLALSVTAAIQQTRAISGADTASKRRKASSPGRRGLAAGLSLWQNAPLGDQIVYSYNINGKGDLASDYIPAPYIQYFLRPNLYLQLTVRYNSPQYTPSVVIDSPRTVPKADLTVFTTSTLQKLYYTDIPISIDYAPVPHWFVGAGVQCSGLRGGMVYQRVVGYDTVSVLPAEYRTGSLSKSMEEAIQLRKIDWRLLLETNYSWNRVALGLRYQQALSPFSRKPSSAGAVKEKNAALGFYLQYRLWERKRKN